MDVGLLRQYAADGLTRKEIAEKTGMSYTRVTTVLRENGIFVERKKHDCKPRGPRERTIKIIELRKKGLMHKEIAKIVGITEDSVKSTCIKYGITKPNHCTEETAKQTVISLGFDYVGGFTNTKGRVDVKCRSCGTVFSRYYDAIRNDLNGKRKEKITCPECARIKREQYREKKKEPKLREAQIKAERAQQDRAAAISRQLERRLANHVCKNCGKEYCMAVTGYNSELYCSDKCQKRWHNREKNEKRMGRLITRKHDKDITLEKLFARDGGLCYICGKSCDWNDIIEVDGTRIAGDNYPSIDHGKPVSKGGTHTWDNIKLACRSCNTLKGWKNAPHLNCLAG